MSGAHEPREAFVNQLEGQLRGELRRRNLAPPPYSWLPQSRLAFALGVAAIAIVSMAMGGGAVAAAYEARLSEQRETLLGSLQQRASLAQRRLELANEQLASLQQSVSVGIVPQRSVAEAQLKVKEAQTELNRIQLDIAEVQATGQEPKQAVSSPLVSGRDFVIERWRAEMQLPAAALELEKLRLDAARSRLEVGLGDARDIDQAAMRIAELESALVSIERKIAIRQTFLMGGMPAKIADLRGLEAETDARRGALARRIEFGERQISALRARVEVGTENVLTVAEATLRLQEMQLELSKADYDLLLIRQQLGR